MVNKVILLGNVGREPKMSYPAKGQAVAQFSLATNERARTRPDGTTVPERTEWHNIVMTGRNAEIAERYIHKGTRLYLEGKLRTRSWNDRNAITHYITEVYVDVVELLGATQNPAGDSR